MIKKDKVVRNYTNKALVEEAGFSSTQRFTNAFVSRVGISPTYFSPRTQKVLRVNEQLALILNVSIIRDTYRTTCKGKALQFYLHIDDTKSLSKTSIKIEFQYLQHTYLFRNYLWVCFYHHGNWEPKLST